MTTYTLRLVQDCIMLKSVVFNDFNLGPSVARSVVKISGSWIVENHFGQGFLFL